MKYLLFFMLLLISSNSYAVREIFFRGETKVYAEQNEKSEVIGIYNKGDSIPISNIKYGGWRKVIVDYEGRKRIGWVQVKDAKGSKIRKKQDDFKLVDNKKVPVYKRKTGLGVLTSLNYTYQSSGDVKFTVLDTEFKAEYDSATGTNFFFGFFGDFNLSKKTALRGYLTLRSMNRSGDADITNPISGGIEKRNFRLEQDLITLGSTLKFYSRPQAQFWWGPGIEIGTSSDFKFVSDKAEEIQNDITVEVKDDPTYIFLNLSAGYDLHIGGSFFLLPEARLSIIPNGDPLIVNFEVWVPLALSF